VKSKRRIQILQGYLNFELEHSVDQTRSGPGIRERQLLRAAREAEATAADADEYGERYIVDLELAWNDRWSAVRSAWIIRQGEGFPRLTSCYVLLK
jgi:hypothetical protein